MPNEVQSLIAHIHASNPPPNSGKERFVALAGHATGDLSVTIGKFGVILEQVHGMDCLEKFFSSADFTTTTPWLQTLRLFIQHAIRYGFQSEAAAAIHSSSGRIQEETQAILRIFFPRELQR